MYIFKLREKTMATTLKTLILSPELFQNNSSKFYHRTYEGQSIRESTK